jgi:hypothetical protein
MRSARLAGAATVGATGARSHLRHRGGGPHVLGGQDPSAIPKCSTPVQVAFEPRQGPGVACSILTVGVPLQDLRQQALHELQGDPTYAPNSPSGDVGVTLRVPDISLPPLAQLGAHEGHRSP